MLSAYAMALFRCAPAFGWRSMAGRRYCVPHSFASFEILERRPENEAMMRIAATPRRTSREIFVEIEAYLAIFFVRRIDLADEDGDNASKENVARPDRVSDRLRPFGRADNAVPRPLRQGFPRQSVSSATPARGDGPLVFLTRISVPTATMF